MAASAAPAPPDEASAGGQLCFLFVAGVHLLLLGVLAGMCGAAVARRLRPHCRAYALASLAEKAAALLLYLHGVRAGWSGGSEVVVDADLFAASIRLVCHFTLSLAILAELLPTKQGQLMAVPVCVVWYVGCYMGLELVVAPALREEIHSTEPFILVTTGSVLNMMLLTVFCLYIGIQAEKTNKVTKLIGFHAIVDILHNLAIQLLLSADQPIQPSVLILLNYAKDLFLLFVYVVRVMNASIVEVEDEAGAGAVSARSVESADSTPAASPRPPLQLVRY